MLMFWEELSFLKALHTGENKGAGLGYAEGLVGRLVCVLGVGCPETPWTQLAGDSVCGLGSIPARQPLTSRGKNRLQGGSVLQPKDLTVKSCGPDDCFACLRTEAED